MCIFHIFTQPSFTASLFLPYSNLCTPATPSGYYHRMTIKQDGTWYFGVSPAVWGNKSQQADELALTNTFSVVVSLKNYNCSVADVVVVLPVKVQTSSRNAFCSGIVLYKFCNTANSCILLNRKIMHLTTAVCQTMPQQSHHRIQRFLNSFWKCCSLMQIKVVSAEISRNLF